MLNNIIFTLILLILPNLNCAKTLPDSSGWDQFRGAARNGQISDVQSGRTWVEPAPVLLWSKEIGPGFSEVAVVGERVYLMTAEMTDSISGWEHLVCLDASTGSEIWRAPIDTVYIDVDEWGDGSRSTPAIDDHMVFCFSASGRLVAVNRVDGNIIWQVDFVTQFGSERPRWGFATSPLLIDELVIMEAGGADNHGIIALEKATGKVKWHGASFAAAYNSPFTIDSGGGISILHTNGSKLHAYDPFGDSLWVFTMPLRSPMALPLFIPPGSLFISATNDAGSFLVDLTDNGPVLRWTSAQMKNDWSSSCYRDGHIYGFNIANLQCIDVENGQRKWSRRGFGKGSLIMVNDRLVILSDQGRITIAQASPEAFVEIASLDALEGRSWTAPSYSGGLLFVRNHTRIACFRMME